ncbi:MAG TPA: potassium/proton antiporter [Candidatus Omnitrophota bacterium]|mgnify:FL=1|nr:potassium/proton antiporter [Candidatus Omnitrophota bacterium]
MFDASWSITIEQVLLAVSLLLLMGVFSSKVSDRFAIPVLLLFLAIGMLAGSEGPGKIYFDNAPLAKSIGIIALIFIIFHGGLDTDWEEVRPVLWHAALLSTIGVLLTAVITGYFAMLILKFSFLEGMLLGSIVSSTDAAAVFSILRSRRISLKQPLKPLLELESGSNDPMAVFLTTGFIGLMSTKEMSLVSLIPMFFLDMGVGALVGLLMARLIVYLLRRVELEYEGLYPVVMIALVLLTYVTAVFLKGNGILAVYLAGLMLGRSRFPNKRTLLRFQGGLAWLMQITMFVTLGMLVFPSHIIPLMGAGLLLTLLLMVVARPVSVFLCLLPFKLSFRKKTMIAWVGLRGSVPIILATFPFMAGVPQAGTIFNVVFFVVFASVLIQGTSIPVVSKWLKLDTPLRRRVVSPIEFEKTEAMEADLLEFMVPYSGTVAGKKLYDLDFPKGSLAVLVGRNNKFIVAKGDTALKEGDVVLALVSPPDLERVKAILNAVENKKTAGEKAV